MAIYDYRIASGQNLPLGSLTNVEDITPTGDRSFYPPQTFGSYDPGAARLRPDGSVYHAGFPSVVWKWRSMTRDQYKYLQDTYCNGGYSGTVTIYTRTEDDSAYERYNATLRLPKMPEADLNFTHFTNVDVLMIRLVAL